MPNNDGMQLTAEVVWLDRGRVYDQAELQSFLPDGTYFGSGHVSLLDYPKMSRQEFREHFRKGSVHAIKSVRTCLMLVSWVNDECPEDFDPFVNEVVV